MKTSKPQIIVLLAIALLVSSSAPLWAQQNPCNPCAKNPCNPCAKNPCNPCGGKAGGLPNIAVNPCHAKQGTVYYFADPMKRNTVTISSEAPLEDMNGISNEVYGYVVFNRNTPNKIVGGKVWVPVASIDTGIPLRNEHMLSANWLNAEKYPNITYEIDRVVNIEQVKSSDQFQTYQVTLAGTFSLHGVSKEKFIPVRVTYLQESEMTKQRMPGNLLAARSEFTVPLKTFNIMGPAGMKIIGARVSEEIDVELSVFGSDVKPSGAMNPCNPCAKNPCAKNPCAKNPCAKNPCKK